MSRRRNRKKGEVKTTAREKSIQNPPNIIIRHEYELLDTVTGKSLRVADRKLYEKLLAKDSGRYIKV